MMAKDSDFSISTRRVLILFLFVFYSSSHAFQAHIGRRQKLSKQAATSLSFQLLSSDDDDSRKDNVELIVDTEKNATAKEFQVMLEEDDDNDELLRYYDELLKADDDPAATIVPVVVVVAGLVGFAIYMLASNNDENNNALGDFLDWKDVVAFTAGETVSSSILKGLIFFGELFLVGSVVSAATTAKTEKSSNEDDEEKSNAIDWDDLSVDIGSWIVYGYLKDDWLGGKIGIPNSAVESALFGVVSALSTRLAIDFVSPQEQKQHNEGREWFNLYSQGIISAAVLFSVYDFTLHLLPGSK